MQDARKIIKKDIEEILKRFEKKVMVSDKDKGRVRTILKIWKKKKVSVFINLDNCFVRES